MAERTWTSWIVRREVSPSSPAGYVHRPERLRGSNRVELLAGGGEAFPAMLEAIAAARERVLLNSYTIRSDRIGQLFKQALLERAAAGVRVLVCFDALGSLGTASPRYFQELRAGDVQVLEFRPLAPWRKHWGLGGRNHQKVLVVDGEVGFTGGINLGAEYAPAPEGGGWIDLHARVQGPAALDLERVFARTWEKGGGPPLERSSAPDDTLGPEADPVLVQTVDSGLPGRQQRMRRVARHALARARHTILIANAYFIPDLRTRRALRAAIRRGVSVRVLVPGRSDVPVAQSASRYLYRRLLRAGVRLYEAEGPMMHAKAAVVDGVWSTLGSYNVDHLSLARNLEAAIVVADADFGARLEATIRDEMGRAREVDLGTWIQRPLLGRALEWICFQFRFWL